MQQTFSAALVVADYETLDQEFQISETIGRPSTLAAHVAFQQMYKWKDSQHPDANLKLVVDQGIPNWGELDDLVHRNIGERMIPAKVKDTPALQACDLAGWEQNRALTTGLITNTVNRWNELRGSYRALIERFPSPRWFCVGEDEIRKTFADFPDFVPKR